MALDNARTVASETQGAEGRVGLTKARLRLAAAVIACAFVLGALVKLVVVGISTPEAGLACNEHATAATAIATARKFVTECGSGFRIEKQINAMKSSGSFASYAQVGEYAIRAPADSPSGPALFLLVGRRTRGEPWRTLEVGTGP